jgi:hypothetical protein
MIDDGEGARLLSHMASLYLVLYCTHPNKIKVNG